MANFCSLMVARAPQSINMFSVFTSSIFGVKKLADTILRVTVRVPDPQQAKNFNDFILRTSQKQGKIIAGIQSKIFRVALKEFLEKHWDDLDIDWNNVE